MTPLEKKLNALRPAFARVAQVVYDEWEQNEEGFCDWWGYGGICQDIAAEHVDLIVNVLEGVDALTFASNIEQHVYTVVADDKDAVIVDIPPSVYEIGAGYCWQKIPGVQFHPDDIVIYSVERDDFIDEYDEFVED